MDTPHDDPQGMPVYQRIGELTRKLHDTLRELGYDKHLEHAAGALPDARTRLSFIAEKTGDSAERVLNLVDRAKSEQGRLHEAAIAAVADLKANPVAAVASGRVLAFLEDAAATSAATDGHLTDIMMAQDFHDLTGQVIQKVVALAQEMEEALVRLLVEARPPEARPGAEQGFLNGPAMGAAQRTDVVTDQSQVDDLLESLGF